MTQSIKHYLLNPSCPSLLVAVIFNSLLWGAMCLLPDDPIETRRTTVYMSMLASGYVWSAVFFVTGFYQWWAFASQLSSNTHRIVSNALAAMVNVTVLAAIAVSVYPLLPVLLPGQIVVTCASCLLFITTHENHVDKIHARQSN